jgi:hypothetical protein
MKRIVRLTESDLARIVRRVISEQNIQTESTNKRRKMISEQSPKQGATVNVDSPSKGDYDAPVPTDSATLGMASKIVGQLMTAFGGLGTDDAKARAAIYSINSPKLYYAVLWKVQNSTALKNEYGKNFDLVGEFLSEDMSYAAGQKGGHVPGGTRDVGSPGAGIQKLVGTAKQYADYERHLQQFNKNEYIKTETFEDR